MANRKYNIKKIILLVLLLGITVGGGIAYYIFNMPHIDVQAQKADYTVSTTALVSEYLQDEKLANEKYLGNEGDSKIFVVTGTVKSMDINLNNQKTVLLQEDADKAGVMCVFMAETNAHAAEIKIGEHVSIKGIIRSGANYDEDLELYENVLLEKCDLVKE
ncbi:MAG: hypothetical protein SGJ00_04390 [bacterium]|nr:hypothetical protein [bacterium]